MTVRRGDLGNCALCGEEFARHSKMHIYCGSCSEIRSRERSRKWAQGNPLSPDKQRAKRTARTSNAKTYGITRSTQERETIAWDPSSPLDLVWVLRVSVPFSYSYSKNHIFAMRPGGHVVLRREARDVRATLTDELAAALHRAGIRPVPGKLWIDLFVQKSNQRGDAVNVIDLVCDAIKDATHVDDRWFSIRRLDWQIVKDSPKIYVGIGQETTEPMQCCSRCGRALLYSAFNKSRSAKLGIGRTCRECESTGRIRIIEEQADCEADE